MMGWLLLAAVAVAVALRAARRRRSLFTVTPSDAISTVNLERVRRQTARTRAALEAATAALR